MRKLLNTLNSDAKLGNNENASMKGKFPIFNKTLTDAEFFALVKANPPQYQQIKAWILRKQNLKITDDLGQTPLMYAAAKGDLELVRILANSHYANQQDIQQEDKNGDNALIYALKNSTKNSSQIAGVLLEKGAAFNLNRFQKETSSTFNLDPAPLLPALLKALKVIQPSIIKKITSKHGELSYDCYLELLTLYHETCELLNHHSKPKTALLNAQSTLYLFLEAIKARCGLKENKLAQEQFPIVIDCDSTLFSFDSDGEENHAHSESKLESKTDCKKDIKSDQRASSDDSYLYLDGERLTTQTSIAKLAQYAFETYYKKPYEDHEVKANGIARELHGATHAGSAAHLVRPLIKFIKKYFPDQVAEILDLDITLIQLAVIYHDTANTGESFHDEEKHAANFKRDALKLGFSKEKVEKLAHAIQHKDQYKTKGSLDERTIYQMLVHDADCLEFLRCFVYPNQKNNVYQILKDFRPNELDLMKLVTTKLHGEQKEQALKEIDNLITQHAYLVKHFYEDPDIHKQCEHGRYTFYDIGSFRAHHQTLEDYYRSSEEAKAFALTKTVINHAKVQIELKTRRKIQDQSQVIGQENKDLKSTTDTPCMSEIHLRNLVAKSTLTEMLDTFIEKKAIGDKKNYDERFKTIMLEVLNKEKLYEQKGYKTFYHSAPHDVALVYDIVTEFHRLLNYLPETDYRRFRFADGVFNSNKSFAAITTFIDYFTNPYHGRINNYTGNYQEMGLSLNPFLFGSTDNAASATYYLFANDIAGGNATDNNFLTDWLMSISPYLDLSPEEKQKIETKIKSINEKYRKQGSVLCSIHVENDAVDNIIYPSVTLGAVASFAEKNKEDKVSMLSTLNSFAAGGLTQYLNQFQGRYFMHPALTKDHVKVESVRYQALSSEEELCYQQAIRELAELMISTLLAKNKANDVLYSPQTSLNATYLQAAENGVSEFSLENFGIKLKNFLQKKDYKQADKLLKQRPHLLYLGYLKTIFDPEILTFNAEEFFEVLNLNSINKSLKIKLIELYVFSKTKPIDLSFENIFNLFNFILPEDKLSFFIKLIPLFQRNFSSLPKKMLDKLLCGNKDLHSEKLIKELFNPNELKIDGDEFAKLTSLNIFDNENLFASLVSEYLPYFTKIFSSKERLERFFYLISPDLKKYFFKLMTANINKYNFNKSWLISVLVLNSELHNFVISDIFLPLRSEDFLRLMSATQDEKFSMSLMGCHNLSEVISSFAIADHLFANLKANLKNTVFQQLMSEFKDNAIKIEWLKSIFLKDKNLHNSLNLDFFIPLDNNDFFKFLQSLENNELKEKLIEAHLNQLPSLITNFKALNTLLSCVPSNKKNSVFKVFMDYQSKFFVDADIVDINFFIGDNPELETPENFVFLISVNRNNFLEIVSSLRTRHVRWYLIDKYQANLPKIITNFSELMTLFGCIHGEKNKIHIFKLLTDNLNNIFRDVSEIQEFFENHLELLSFNHCKLLLRNGESLLILLDLLAKQTILTYPSTDDYIGRADDFDKELYRINNYYEQIKLELIMLCKDNLHHIIENFDQFERFFTKYLPDNQKADFFRFLLSKGLFANHQSSQNIKKFSLPWDRFFSNNRILLTLEFVRVVSPLDLNSFNNILEILLFEDPMDIASHIVEIHKNKLEDMISTLDELKRTLTHIPLSFRNSIFDVLKNKFINLLGNMSDQEKISYVKDFFISFPNLASTTNVYLLFPPNENTLLELIYGFFPRELSWKIIEDQIETLKKIITTPNVLFQFLFQGIPSSKKERFFSLLNSHLLVIFKNAKSEDIQNFLSHILSLISDKYLIWQLLEPHISALPNMYIDANNLILIFKSIPKDKQISVFNLFHKQISNIFTGISFKNIFSFLKINADFATPSILALFPHINIQFLVDDFIEDMIESFDVQSSECKDTAEICWQIIQWQKNLFQNSYNRLSRFDQFYRLLCLIPENKQKDFIDLVQKILPSIYGRVNTF